jgi:hypothetical protein
MNYTIRQFTFCWLITTGFTFLYAQNSNTFDIYNTISIDSIHKLTNIPTNNIIQIINFLKEEQKKHLVTWSKTYLLLPNLITQMNLKKGCEIGVAFGTHSESILKNSNVEKLYSVDPYMHFNSGYDDGMNLNQSYFDILFLFCQKRLSQFENRSVLIRKTSVDAAQQFNKNELDFVYIDANHSYEGVKQDLEHWYEKVKPGGVVAGDDYDHPCFPGTKKAIDEFFNARGLKVNQYPGVKLFFWVVKPLND